MGCRLFRLKPLAIGLVIICSAIFILENSVSRSRVNPLIDFVSINSSELETRKFAFMKNHKCASTTIENIIFRFAYKHQLKLVIPAEGNYLSKTTLFERTTALKKAKWKDVEFDVFALHNRWNHNEVKALLGENIPTFTIVRDPVDAFVSMFHFQPDFKKYYRVDDIHAFVAKVKTMGDGPYMNRRWLGIVGRNQMAWDMGLPPNIFKNKTQDIDREIKRLDSEFDLVMVSSRMDESLILLRDLLHWPTEAIIHLNLNRRKQSSPPLSDEERQILYEWLSVDARIYDYFSKRFEERITAANNSKSQRRDAKTYVQREVEELQAANRELYKTCVTAEVGNEKLKGKFKEGIDTIKGYVINEEVRGCELFALSEPAYLEVFKKILLEAVEDSKNIS